MKTLCLGEALVDLVCERPVSSLAEADAFAPHFGGATANVAVSTARHGGDAALAGGAGADAWGAWLRARLEQEGVDLSWFNLVEGVSTPVAFVTVDAGGEASFQIYGSDIARTVAALGDTVLEAVEACDALFLATNTLVGEDERELTLAARERALELGRPVVFDPNFRLGRWETKARAGAAARECVPGAFLVRCNRLEAEIMTGEADPEAAAASLLAAGAKHVVVTLGADGAILRGGKVEATVPGVPAAPVDTTGAGDAFVGVLLARLGATGYYPPAIAAALPEAVEVGARTTERWGAVG